MANEIEKVTINVANIPKDALDYLRLHAQRDGHPDSDASTARFAIVELAKRLRADETAGETWTPYTKEPTDG